MKFIIETLPVGEDTIEGVYFEDKVHWRFNRSEFTLCGKPSREFDWNVRKAPEFILPNECAECAKRVREI